MVMQALQKQTLDKSEWEFLLVDSGSEIPLSSRVDLSWHPLSRCVREDVGGLTRARLRGIAEAGGELLVFVDDDNELDADFLENALRLASAWPTIGAWSGASRPRFDSAPAEWTKRYWGNLVIRDVPSDLWSNLPLLPETMPCGAGLCVRRQVAAHYCQLHDEGKRGFVLDRTGQSLMSGGDNDLAACACDLGMGVGIFSSLRLTHLIPDARLQEDYLVALAKGIALSAILLRSFRGDSIRRPTTKRRIADILRMMLLSRRERRFFRATRQGEREAYRMLESNLASSQAPPF